MMDYKGLMRISFQSQILKLENVETFLSIYNNIIFDYHRDRARVLIKKNCFLLTQQLKNSLSYCYISIIAATYSQYGAYNN